MSRVTLNWVPTTSQRCKTLTNLAVVVGYEGHDRSPIYVGRAHHNGDLLPCKVIPRHNVAYIAFNGKETRVDNFEMFCKSSSTARTAPGSQIVIWLPGANGSIPPGALVVGTTSTGESLYVGRVSHMGSLTPGKVHPSHRCCYIPFGGAELSFPNYEVMVSATQ